MVEAAHNIKNPYKYRVKNPFFHVRKVLTHRWTDRWMFYVQDKPGKKNTQVKNSQKERFDIRGRQTILKV